MSVKSIIRSALLPVLSPLMRDLLNTTTMPRTISSNEFRQRLHGGVYAKQLYRGLVPASLVKAEINDHELGVYSQHGEDGILLFIYSCIGTTNRTFVEFGVEDGTECNSANLAINFGFNGLLMDGSARNVSAGTQFYDAVLGSRSSAVKMLQSWVTVENINATLAANGFTGEIDLLSIDVDGNDYWIWKAIETISPRVVVIEYNACLGPTRSVTVPYKCDFNRWDFDPSGFYYGASLAAFSTLARSKGYSLVGCESCGVNAFFVKSNLLSGDLAEISPENAHYYHLSPALRGMSPDEQYACIRSLPWSEV